MGPNMSNHAYARLFYHFVWSTKNCKSFIKKEYQDSLHKFIGKTLTKKEWYPIAIGGIEDHMHILVQANLKEHIADIVASVKASSSRFMRKNFDADFAWQGGYGVFSVDSKMLDVISNYILKQEQHHKTKNVKSEFRLLLQRGHVSYADIARVKYR